MYRQKQFKAEVPAPSSELESTQYQTKNIFKDQSSI